ncbi:O-antigen ligase family protein [Rubripirellula lacrimiformis]|nr:O-antigen ligase family protein [Rubripirellula lacrimiformis]
MQVLIALFALAALVWLVPMIQHGRLMLVAMAVLGVGTVLGPAFFAVDGPIQISLDRVLWGAMFALAAIGWRMGNVRLPKLNRLDWMVVGVVGWFFIRAAMGGAVPDGSSPVARWLFYIAMPAGMYLIARLVTVQQQDIQIMMIGMVGLGLYLAVTAVFEVYGVHGLVFPRYIVDGEVWEFFGRGRGPLMNPSGNGILISIALVAAALGFVYAGRRGKLVYAVIVTVLMVGLYATLTRSAWMGGIAAIGLVAMLYSPRWVRVLGLAMVVLFGGAFVMGLKDQLVQMKRDKNLTAADAQKSMALRPLLAIVAWEMFKDRPIAGHGFGHYFAHNDPYHSQRGYDLPLEIARPYNQHNVVLSVLVDTGLVGASLFVGWLVSLMGVGWRLVREANRKPEVRCTGVMLLGTMIAYLINGMFQDVLIIPMVHMFLFYIAGVAVTVRECEMVIKVPENAKSPALRGAAANGYVSAQVPASS